MSGAASVAGSLHDDASGRGVKHGLEVEAGGAQSSASAAAEAHTEERPAKSAKEAAHKVPRINAVNAGPHNDVEVTPFLEDAELDALEDYDYALDDSDFVQTFDDSQFLGTPSALYRPKPADGGEPQLSASELEQIDAIAEDFEVNRLVHMGVLAPLEDDDPFVHTARLLSTKYVTTWRLKPDPANPEHNELFLRRSRLVGREFSWLEPDREQLFSPASNNLLVRILPSLAMTFRHKGWVSLSLDISDAFLTVSQKIDTCIRVRTASGGSRVFRLIKMLPGQRDGTLNWADELTGFLRENVSIETFPQSPALCRTADCQAGLLIHVDDVYGAGHRKKLQEIASVIQSKYKATLAWLIEPGDCISFLKRSYELVDEETLVMRPHSKHAERLVSILHLESRRAKATPMPTTVPLDSTPLDEEQAGTFRSAVGILLYLAPDAIECQNCIRLLSQQMSAPTAGGLKLLKHLVCYLKSVTGYGLAFGTPVPGDGIVTKGNATHCLELFTDADWSGDRQSRRSTTSSVIAFNGHVLATSSRTQKTVSLSSCESEFNSYVSGMVDFIYVNNAIEFLLGASVLRFTYIDSSSAKSLITRQGVGRTRHLEGKLLWVQELSKQGYMQVSGVNTLRNPSDLGTKSLARERILCLLHMLNVVDVNNGNQAVGLDEYGEMEKKLALRGQVRRLQQRVSLSGQSEVLMNALRIAMILNEISSSNALSLAADMSPITQAWTDAVWFVNLMLDVVQAACERMIVSAVQLCLDHPSVALIALMLVTLGPWCVVLCCYLRKPSASGSEASAVVQPESRTSSSVSKYVKVSDEKVPKAKAAMVSKAAETPVTSASAATSSSSSRTVEVSPEVHVYVTLRRGKSYHSKRGCSCLNMAEEIIRLGLQEAISRGYVPCKACYKMSTKKTK